MGFLHSKSDTSPTELISESKTDQIPSTGSESNQLPAKSNRSTASPTKIKADDSEIVSSLTPVGRRKTMEAARSAWQENISRIADGLIVVLLQTLLIASLMLIFLIALPSSPFKTPNAIVDCVMGTVATSAFIFALFTSCPILLPVTCLIMQLAAGVFVGDLLVTTSCIQFGVDPTTIGALRYFSWIFTFCLAILPAIAPALYVALSISSSRQATWGLFRTGFIVSDRQGHRLTFKQALKRTALSQLSPFLYQIASIKDANPGGLKKWLDSSSSSRVTKRPQKIEEAIEKSEHKVSVSFLPTVRFERFFEQEDLTRVLVNSESNSPFFRRALAVVRLQVIIVLYSVMIYFLTLPQSYVNNLFFLGGPSSGIIPAWINLQGPFRMILELFPLVALALFLPIPLWIVWDLFVPNSLELSKKGIQFRHSRSRIAHPLLPWASINSLAIEHIPNKSGPSSSMLVLSLKNRRKRRISLADIGSITGKEEFLKAVERWAPQLPRDAAVIQALQPPCDYSYTELWLDALSAPPKRDKLQPLIEGAVLRTGQYHVINMIGVGGQGFAYLAQDCLTGENVVLKEFVLPVYVDIAIRRRALERFEQEARLLKELSHDQIVKLLDYFVEDHRAYLVLEHIDGHSLKTLIENEGPVSEERARQLGLQMCSILKYLHNQSPPVVHRDFTPDNLILRTDGNLKLIDFNVAHQSEETVIASVVGKPAYLPPEQFRGMPSTRSDIYAMGGCLFYLLTGEEPTPITASSPLLLKPETSETLDKIVTRATMPEEKDRYQTILELEKELTDESPDPLSSSSTMDPDSIIDSFEN
jgi:tRNA A-37 threonylcarbamoyl transferase component Bud32